MNPSVGSARSGDVNFMIKKPAQSLFELSLHGSKVRLTLPSMKRRPVVGEGQLEVPHSGGYNTSNEL
jgi:hypothetical protein